MHVCVQIEELETQMAEMQQSTAVLAEAESALRQQVSGLQVIQALDSCMPIRWTI